MHHYLRNRAILFAALLTSGGVSAQNVFVTGASAQPQAETMLAAPDFAKLSMEDAKRTGGAWRYGVQIPVDGSVFGGQDKRGIAWETLADGRKRWSWRLTAPGAKTLDFHFKQLQLPARGELILRGTGADNLRIIAASELTPDGGDYWSPYVLGEQVDLEIVVPAGATDQVRMELASVTHGYRGLFEAAADPMLKSGSCNVDVVCPAGVGWEDQIDSVGHYTFSQGGSSYVCTGTLVANTAQTTTPYFLTANHCVSSQSVASSMVVYWNYQSSTCRTPGSGSSGTPLPRSIASHSQSGATLVANYASSDFALLELNSAVPAGADAYYSGWDASGATPSSAAGIHHPAGHEKRIAIEDDALGISGYGGGSGSTHWRVFDWDQGTTEGGSSGSGLWNQNKRLVGQLHGGSAACGNNLSDYYGRLSVSWNGGGSSGNRLRDWLDPGSTGATTLAGYRTGGDPDPDPDPDDVLENGVPVPGLSGGAGAELRFTLEVPSGASNLVFQISGGTGDADLYVRHGSPPTTGSYTCRPYLNGNNETCTIPSPAAGTWHVMVRGYTAFSGVTLVGSFDTGGGGQSFFENTANYTISDLQTTESPIAVNRPGNAPSNLQVDVRIIHTYRGDLIVNLVAPDGSTYLLHNGTGGSADNLIGTYSVNASSEAATGTWKLRVYDRYNGDTGYIDSWSLQF